MNNTAYRYVICGCSTVLIFISVGLLSNTFPIYFPFIMEELSFSNTQISLLTTMRNITSLISMLITDRYYRKMEIKRGIGIVLCFAVASYTIYGLSASPALFYLAAACSGICYGMGGMIPASILINRWFPDHSGTAMGIAASGSGAASILGPLLITFLIRTFGLSNAFLMEAALMAACVIPLVVLIKNRPQANSLRSESVGKGPSGSAHPDASNSAQSRRDLTHSEQNRVLFAMFLIGFLGITGFSGLTLLYTTAGHSVETVSLFLSMTGFILIAGKCSFGWIADRLGSRAAVTMFGISLMTGQLLCCFADHAGTLLLTINLLFLGLGLAISTVALSIIAADFCPEGRYDTTIRNYQLAYALGGLVSSPVPGILADRTGSYIPAFFLLFLTSVAVFFLLVSLYRRLYI